MSVRNWGTLGSSTTSTYDKNTGSSPLMGPPDRMVDWVIGIPLLVSGISGPLGVAAPGGHLWSVVLILVRSAISPQKVRSTLIRDG
jgi:hypothetical protein